MKKLSIALCILMIAVFLFTLVGCDRPQEPDTLVVYNWADYIYDYEDDFKAYYKGMAQTLSWKSGHTVRFWKSMAFGPVLGMSALCGCLL